MAGRIEHVVVYEDEAGVRHNTREEASRANLGLAIYKIGYAEKSFSSAFTKEAADLIAEYAKELCAVFHDYNIHYWDVAVATATATAVPEAPVPQYPPEGGPDDLPSSQLQDDAIQF